MDAATAALVGTGIGAAVTLAATFGSSILQGRRERTVRKEDAIARLQMERRVEYVKLLTAARELRYIFIRKRQGQAARPAGEVDSLLTQLSAAYYMIALTAPEDTRRLAWDLRESIFELWRADHPESEQYRGHLREARENTALFRSHVTTELKLTELGTSGIGTTSVLPHGKAPRPLPGGGSLLLYFSCGVAVDPGVDFAFFPSQVLAYPVGGQFPVPPFLPYGSLGHGKNRSYLPCGEHSVGAAERSRPWSASPARRVLAPLR